MYKSVFQYKDISKNIRKRYIFALSVIVFALIFSQIVIQYQIYAEKNQSRIVNISGRQRMLSQRISKDVYGIYLSKDKKTKDFYLNELKLSVNMWKKSNNDLKVGNPQEGLPGNNSSKIMELFSEIQINHEEMLNAAYAIIAMVESENYSNGLLRDKIKIIESNEGQFLEGMNNIVFQYDLESKEKIKLIRNTELFLLFLTLIVILLEALFIFIPAEKSLSKAFKEIMASGENLMKLFQTAPVALFLIDEKNSHVLLMNKQAEEFAHINNIDNKSVKFENVIKGQADNYDKILEKIKINEKIEDLEVIFHVNESEKIVVLISSVKIYFNKKASILIGLSDITEQKQEEEVLRTIAITDKLTGLYNRYFFEIRIIQEIERSDCYNDPISLIIFDLDKFKRVNDTWGHPVGDEIIKQTAIITSRMIRKSDLMIRLGGEEFAVLMTHTTINDAMVVAEKLCEALDKNTHPVVGKYTCSFGVGERLKGESFESWYKRVDKALYDAKNKGRNCVISSNDQ